MTRTTTAIIGAGQCGLAMSKSLSDRGIDHVVIEAGRAGESWRSKRWDSLRLLSPNWMNGLAGTPYEGADPNGFMTCKEFSASFDAWVMSQCPPLIGGETVMSLAKGSTGYRIETDAQSIEASSVVVATGQCALPKRPVFATELPGEIAQVSPIDYKSPDQLPDGGVLVVGAAASGLQLARELRLSGRRVVLAVGNHMRLPRRYRDHDIMTWMSLAGLFEAPAEADDLERLRRLPSLPLIGGTDHADIDLNSLQGLGVEIVGRFADMNGANALFSGNLANLCASADLKMNRLLDEIDGWIAEHIPVDLSSPHRMDATKVPSNPKLSLNLTAEGIGTVVWASGFAPDHRFIDLPVFDRKGRIQHDQGIVGDGFYVMGLNHLRTARSTHIDGAFADAEVLAEHLTSTTLRKRAA